jgi:hypothetical protein
MGNVSLTFDVDTVLIACTTMLGGVDRKHWMSAGEEVGSVLS